MIGTFNVSTSWLRGGSLPRDRTSSVFQWWTLRLRKGDNLCSKQPTTTFGLKQSLYQSSCELLQALLPAGAEGMREQAPGSVLVPELIQRHSVTPSAVCPLGSSEAHASRCVPIIGQSVPPGLGQSLLQTFPRTGGMGHRPCYHCCWSQDCLR